MTDFLNLWQWNVESTTELPEGTRVAASYEVQPGYCPKCAVVGELYRFNLIGQSVTLRPDAGASDA